MATLNDAHVTRWKAIRTTIPYNPSHAIPTFFREHPEVGSPLGPEMSLGDGGVAQAFTGGVLRWHPDTGVTVVKE